MLLTRFEYDGRGNPTCVKSHEYASSQESPGPRLTGLDQTGEERTQESQSLGDKPAVACVTRVSSAAQEGSPVTADVVPVLASSDRKMKVPTENPTDGVPDVYLDVPSPIPEIPEVRPTSWKEVFDVSTVPDCNRKFMEGFLSKYQDILSLHAADVGKNSDDRFMFPIDVPPTFRMPRFKPYPASPAVEKFIDDTCNL